MELAIAEYVRRFESGPLFFRAGRMGQIQIKKLYKLFRPLLWLPQTRRLCAEHGSR